MYRVEYYCQREKPPMWRHFQTVPDFGWAVEVCKDLLFRYHSARVIDPNGQVVYQI